MSPILMCQPPADFYTRCKIYIECYLMQPGIAHKSMVFFAFYGIQTEAAGLKFLLDTMIKIE